ncbi:hypothetical protein [Rhodococcus globerulus]|nr:hypothetical protein [Rhodococcus globerulus]
MIDEIPVVDVIVQPYNLSPSNENTPPAESITPIISRAHFGFRRTEFSIEHEEDERNWPVEKVMAMTFMKSPADLARHHVLPTGALHDGVGIHQTFEGKERRPQRFCLCADVDLMQTGLTDAVS